MHFTGDWASQPSKQINEVLQELIQSRLPGATAVEISVDTGADLAQQYQIDCVPTVLIFARRQAVDKVEGVNIPLLVAKIDEATIKHFPLLASLDAAQAPKPAETLDQRLRKLIARSPLMVFMKGDRQAPRCGFSKQLVALLNSIDCEYDSFDILSDEEVRQGLKTFSNWPTYPQVYHKGELVGGLDIIKVSLGRFPSLAWLGSGRI